MSKVFVIDGQPIASALLFALRDEERKMAMDDLCRPEPPKERMPDLGPQLYSNRAERRRAAKAAKRSRPQPSRS